ncbi:MAG: F0F1 ATP synthase subunit delta [Isosphaeraceae bacterium]
MVFNVWTFLFQVVNFLVLVAILRWRLYEPLRDAIDRRREANEKARNDAVSARREAAGLQATLTPQQLADLDRQREAVIQEAHARAETERQPLIAQTEQSIRRHRAEVDQQFAREREEALRSLRAELVHSAVEMAERLLSEASGSMLQRQLTVELIEELRRIPDDDRQRLRDEWEDGDAAVVETASDLNGEVLHDLGGATESLAGRPLGVSVQVEPALLGGVRLRIGGQVWDTSMVGRLEELEAASSGGASTGGKAS